MTPIFLIGYMGSGKTTLGRALAAKMQCEFIDLDHYIENRFHKTVKQIFADSGEARFRDLETRMLEEVSDFNDVIVACGGGTPCFGRNIDVMREKGLVIYLHVSVQCLFNRLTLPHSKAKRPIIADKTDEELMQFITENVERRHPFYSKAHFMFDATKIETGPETVVTAAELEQVILDYLKNN